MGRYTIRRLLQMIPVILGTTFLIYAATWYLPGDPFAGDSITHLIAQAFPVTFRLTVLAIIFELVVGIGMGIFSALRRGGVFDNGVLIFTLLIISIPIFVVGFLAQYIFGVKLGWFPVTASPEVPTGDLILPAIVLASVSLAFVARLTRASLAENLRADYVRTATAKGLPRRTVVMRHAVRNSLIPVVTFIGADFGVLLGGAIVTEGIFNVPGIGGLTYGAIRLREGATVVAIVTLIVLVFLIVNLIVDLLYAVLDPRIRYE